MNKVTKTVLIAGCALILAGALLCGASYWMADGDWSRYSTVNRSLSRLTYSADAAEVTELRIEETGRAVRLQPAEDGRVTVSYCEEDGAGYEITLSGGVLHVRRERPQDWSGAFRFGVDIPPDDALILRVPADFGGTVSLSNQSGSVELNGLTLCDLSLSVDSGAVRISDLQADSMTVSAGSGSLRMTNVHAQNRLVLAVGSGSVRLENASCASGAVSTLSGTMKLTNLRCTGEWACASNSGAIVLTDCSAASVEAENGSGAITLSALDASDIRLECLSGAISGSLAGSRSDYAITSRTGSGRSNLSDSASGAPRQLSVRTTSGSVHITFELDP